MHPFVRAHVLADLVASFGRRKCVPQAALVEPHPGDDERLVEDVDVLCARDRFGHEQIHDAFVGVRRVVGDLA